MEKIDLNEYLASNEYPGRGIAVAKAPDGRQMFIGYFIMGRSENSRNRVFDPVPERGGICTMAADPAKLEDPSLIIYNPVLTLGRTHIVTNGDQTDTIYDLMSQGKSFADALRTRTFEPDGPNYTPRISAVVYADGSYQMSIQRRLGVGILLFQQFIQLLLLLQKGRVQVRQAPGLCLCVLLHSSGTKFHAPACAEYAVHKGFPIVGICHCAALPAVFFQYSVPRPVLQGILPLAKSTPVVYTTDV